MKKIISLILSVSLLATMLVTPAFAVSTYASAADMIEAVILTATSGVSSTSLSDAITTTKGKVTISDNTVSFDGSVIGYWYEDSSNVLWADSSKSATVIQETEGGWEVLPSTLKTLISDVNSQLIENYVPTSDDWSKIVGKYDVTLGDVTIPADQWITASTFYDPDGITKYLGVQQINDVVQWNITKTSGINGNNISEQYGDNSLYMFAWLIDDSGKLYIQDGMCGLFQGVSSATNTWFSFTDNLSSTSAGSAISVGGSTATDITTVPYIRAGVANTNVATANGSALGDSSNTRLNAILFVTDATIQKAGITFPYTSSNNDITSSILHQVEDPAISNGCKIEDASAYGVVYFKGSQVNVSDTTDVHTWHAKMFESYSCSKLVRGSTQLTKRIVKLDSLTQTDFLTIKNDGWYVADGSSIDALVGNQNVLNAGDTADINAVAEVEPMCFNVVVPTTLPVYIDASGVVSTATNATVTNKSNAAVKMTDINIVAKDSSGWTLVESNPSTVRDAMEFTFTTSLVKDTILDKDEVLPFTYSTELSPLTEGADALDLATVQVTVDWAD